MKQPAQKSFQIEIDGTKHDVSRNLYHALERKQRQAGKEVEDRTKRIEKKINELAEKETFVIENLLAKMTVKFNPNGTIDKYFLEPHETIKNDIHKLLEIQMECFSCASLRWQHVVESVFKKEYNAENEDEHKQKAAA